MSARPESAGLQGAGMESGSLDGAPGVGSGGAGAGGTGVANLPGGTPGGEPRRVFLLPGAAKSAPPGLGIKLTQAARRCGVFLNTRCGHHGLCSGCAVELLAGRFETGGREVEVSGEEPVQAKACLTTVLSDEYAVRVPRRSLVETGAQIATGFSAAAGMGRPLDPVVRRVELSLPEPRETNPPSFVEQLKKALADRDFPGNIAMPLEVVRDLPAAIVRGGGRIVVYLAHEPGRGVGDHGDTGARGPGEWASGACGPGGGAPGGGGPRGAAPGGNSPREGAPGVCGPGKGAGEDGWVIQDVAPAGPARDPEDEPKALLGAAVDIGTTSVVVALVDLESGEIKASASAYNQQVSLSADVAQRIVDASTPEGLRELQRLLVEESINPLLEICCRAAGAESADVRAVGISANTVMTHLLLGISPESMGGAPFVPVISAPPPLFSREIGLAAHRRAQVRIAPAAGAYVGGDIVSGLEVLGYFEYPENALFIDIGTNGEMALSTGGRLIACATPAGPSFEGGGLTFGTRGAAGAIERIRIDPESGAADVEVIGRARPYGICGSAYVDFLAEGLKSGVIDRKGRLAMTPGPSRGRAPVREERVDGKLLRAYCVVPRRRTDDRTRDIVITEGDIAALLQAKAAIFAGAVTLVEHAGLRLSDLQVLHLGGGFAGHLNLENAIWTGLIPELPLDRIRVVGNSSLAGAVLLLCDRHAWRRLRAGAANIEVVELNHLASFEQNFVNALFLPNLDDALFPKTTEALARLGRGRLRPERSRGRSARALRRPAAGGGPAEDSRTEGYEDRDGRAEDGRAGSSLEGGDGAESAGPGDGEAADGKRACGEAGDRGAEDGSTGRDGVGGV